MAAVEALAAPRALPVACAESVRSSRAFRNTSPGAREGCARLTEIICVNVDHPPPARAEVLRKTHDLCTKAHAFEDDGTRRARRHLPSPSVML